jgi:hypothetical protein
LGVDFDVPSAPFEVLFMIVAGYHSGSLSWLCQGVGSGRQANRVDTQNYYWSSYIQADRQDVAYCIRIGGAVNTNPSRSGLVCSDVVWGWNWGWDSNTC